MISVNGEIIIFELKVSMGGSSGGIIIFRFEKVNELVENIIDV